MRSHRITCRLLILTASGWLLLAAASPGAVPAGRRQEPPAGRDCRWPVRPFLEGHLSTLEKGLLADAADGRWDRHSLLAAALVAGGVEEPERLRRYEIRLDRWVAELARSGQLAAPPRGRAEAVFEFMHTRILTGGYQLDATEPARAIDEGRFNCVSSAVLFACLARRCGLAVCCLQMPGHVKTRLLLDDGSLDVETTYAGWFRLERQQDSGDPEKTAQSEHPSPPAASGGTNVAEPVPFAPSLYIPLPSPSLSSRELTPVEAVAMIYYNRGVDLLAKSHFAEAAAANAKALALDPHSTAARGNLLATLNNWAIELAGEGRYGRASSLLSQGLAMAPDYGPFKANVEYLDRCRQTEFDPTASAN